MSKSAQKILDTAEHLFNQHSFSGVGVDLIRDQSGCSKTTMYTYYSNKQQLVIQVLKARDLKFRQSLSTCVQGHDQLDAIHKIYDWHMDWFQTDTFKGCLFIRAVAESTAQDQTFVEIAQQHKSWIKNLIHQQVMSYKHADEITELTYNFLEALISRFLVEGFDLVQAEQNKALLDKLIKCLIDE